MKPAAPLLVALLAAGAVGCGRGGPAADEARAPAAPSVSRRAHAIAAPAAARADSAVPTDSATLAGPELAAALRAIRLRPAPGARVVNDCDEAVTPATRPVDLGGAVGRGWLVAVGGGPKMLTCYGNAGLAFWLLRKEGDAFRVVLADYGLLAVLPAEHGGVKDVAVGGPGFRFPVFVWEDSVYRHRGWISDTLMPSPVMP